MDFRDLYKTRRTLKLAESLAKRSQNVISDRQEKQKELFWKKRVESSKTPEFKPMGMSSQYQ